jgi:hypothetical protein
MIPFVGGTSVPWSKLALILPQRRGPALTTPPSAAGPSSALSQLAPPVPWVSGLTADDPMGGERTQATLQAAPKPDASSKNLPSPGGFSVGPYNFLNINERGRVETPISDIEKGIRKLTDRPANPPSDGTYVNLSGAGDKAGGWGWENPQGGGARNDWGVNLGNFQLSLDRENMPTSGAPADDSGPFGLNLGHWDKQLSPGEGLSSDQTSTEQTSTDQTDQTSTEQTSTEQTSTDQTSTDQTDQTSTDQTSTDQTDQTSEMPAPDDGGGSPTGMPAPDDGGGGPAGMPDPGGGGGGGPAGIPEPGGGGGGGPLGSPTARPSQAWLGQLATAAHGIASGFTGGFSR